MDLLVLEKDYTSLDIIDSYESLIWTDRYRAYGDFELYTSVNSEFLDLCKAGRYLWWSGSEHVMIIEERTIDTDVENGASLTIVGRSLESILDRRIVWKQTIIEGNFQDSIEKLLNEAIISPEDEKRKIPNFIFKKSEDPRITAMELEAQISEGENLYDAIVALCEGMDIGFKITLSDQNELIFTLYKGEDRSYAQETNPYVVFSPDFDNVLNSNYYESETETKNVVLVCGHKADNAKEYVTIGEVSGLDRKEIYTDATDVSYTNETGTEIPAEKFTEQLKQRGNETLDEHKLNKSFEGEIDISQSFVYREDFFLGDIVQIANEYGIESRARVDEMVYSEDESGITTVPTLSAIEDEEKEETE